MYLPTLDAIAVGKTIAHFRQKKGISQEVLSGLADIGRSHLSVIERGERKPTLETLYRICTALDIKMSEVILYLEDFLRPAPPHPPPIGDPPSPQGEGLTSLCKNLSREEIPLGFWFIRYR